MHSTCLVQHSFLDFITIVNWAQCNFLYPLIKSCLLSRINLLPSELCSQIFSVCIFTLCENTEFQVRVNSR